MKWYIEGLGDPPDPKDFPKGITPALYRWTIEQLAEWCHTNMNGWEWTWPKVFVVIDAKGVHHRFEVERHTVPGFEACEVKPKKSLTPLEEITAAADAEVLAKSQALGMPCPQCSTPHVEVRHNDECGAQD